MNQFGMRRRRSAVQRSYSTRVEEFIETIPKTGALAGRVLTDQEHSYREVDLEYTQNYADAKTSVIEEIISRARTVAMEENDPTDVLHRHWFLFKGSYRVVVNSRDCS
jgi:hypothetical protein